MKFLAPIQNLEIKRTFVISNFLSEKKKGAMGKHKKRTYTISGKEFHRKFQAARKQALSAPESALDKIIHDEHNKRLKSYNTYIWHLAEMTPDELGVWRRAADLPLRWTNDSLSMTAAKVAKALASTKRASKLKPRPRLTIPSMLAMGTELFQKEKYLLPIVFRDHTGTNGRKRLKRRMVGDIDDGSMRCIALAICGAKKIRVYFGEPRSFLL